MRSRPREFALHAAICVFLVLTLLPFAFVLNSSVRSNVEFYHAFFGLPSALKGMAIAGVAALRGDSAPVAVYDDAGKTQMAPPREAVALFRAAALKPYKLAWGLMRPYMINTFFVCGLSAMGVMLLGSISAYILSRYRFAGSRLIFYYIISTMMFPAVLTLVPSYLLVKQLGLLDTPWAMILPYIAGGQVFATFVFKSFFDGLPEDLFESARIDGAGHVQLYLNIVVPLSKPVLAVVAIMNILGTWNNFLWPFVTNATGRYHVVASGLYILSTSQHAQNHSVMYAAYTLSSIPLLVLFVYATRPFIQGVTSGAFKA